MRQTFTTLSPVTATDLVLTDDESHFNLPFLTDADLQNARLAPACRNIGVHVGADTRIEMDRLLSGSGGRLYQADSFRGVQHLLNLHEGPMAGIGLLESKRLAAQILSRARVCDWKTMTLCSRLLNLVQRCIEYQTDEASTGYQEYGRFPLQTLEAGEGDCDCVAILTCALLSICGFDSGLAVMIPDDGSDGHVVPALRRLEHQGHFAPRIFGRLNSIVRNRLVPQYLFGEATADDGGVWQPSDVFKTSGIAYLIPLPGDKMIF